MKKDTQWWKSAVLYQVYPRSFKDSNGDGIGDLNGLYEKLDYLQDLGIDVVWLCPMFKSPQDDNGYDISDYQDIHFEFGTMADFDRLLTEMHRRGMRLILDLVLNHTSDEHPWFIESRSSRDNPKRDWYIWRDGKNGKEPNNWESIFEGSVWKYDEKTDQYFLHLFSERQPDLNWENRDMRRGLYDMIRWWLDKGIDGFRIDAISHAKKEPGLPDLPNPERLPYVDSRSMHMNVEGVLDYLSDLCRETFRRYDIMTVGEANGVKAEEAYDWVAEEKGHLNMIIQFEHLKLWGRFEEKKVDVLKLKSIFERWQKGLHGVGWNALFVENHDIPRIASQWGHTGEYWRESCTSIATMYFLMQGTPFIYQGQEIGMTNTVFEGPDDFQDVFAKNHFTHRREEGIADDEITAELAGVARDNARTPMQWSAEAHAGFTTGKPWLKVNPNYRSLNVEAQKRDPHSVLNYYKSLIALRRNNEVFIHGEYNTVLAAHPDVFAYVRRWHGDCRLIICNMRAVDIEINLDEVDLTGAELLLTNLIQENESLGLLRPYEARVYKLSRWD